MFILSLDFGFKYIGIAIGQTITKTASPLSPILLNNVYIDNYFILSLLKKWKPKYIIIGYPISDIYDNLNILNKIDEFVFKIRCEFFINIFYLNEELSTWYIKKKKKFNKEEYFVINSFSAVLLIEQWFEYNYYIG